jgi:small subunit ribosomal protein S1
VAEDSKRSKAWHAEEPEHAVVEAEIAAEAEAAAAAIEKRAEPLPTTDDFAAMFGAEPKTKLTHVNPGDKVSAHIIAIGSEQVFVELGGKTEGALDRSELLDADGELAVKVGDKVEAFVVSVRGGIKLSKGLGKGAENAALLQGAHTQGIPVLGTVSATNKGGYEVEIAGTRAFCPFSQIDTQQSDNPDVHLGQSYQFLITRIEEEGRNVVVSRRKLQEREREEIAAETIKVIAPGAVFEGVVSRVADFGAFVDLGGVDGLVHISELSYVRLEHASDMLSVGDTIRVVVLAVSDLEDPKNRRIALSVKQLQEDPWMSAIKEIQVGVTLTGVVSRMERFGAFVEIGPGVDGLVHISEVSPGRRINHPKEVLNVSDEVQVQVISIDPQKRQIGLSIKSLMDDPWSTAAKSYPVGAAVQGVVDSVQKFGIFVSLTGINGLIPLSQLPEEEAKNVFTRFRTGSDIEARVMAVDADRRRLTLSRREDMEADEKAAFSSYKAQQQETPQLGTFADLLKNR